MKTTQAQAFLALLHLVVFHPPHAAVATQQGFNLSTEPETFVFSSVQLVEGGSDFR
jgi:hypothetical protein